MHRDVLQRVLDARTEQRKIAVVTALNAPDALSANTQFVYPDEDSADAGGLRSAADQQELARSVEAALRRDRSGVVEVAEQRYFIHVHSTPLKMIIVGAVHIAQALVPLAVIAGYSVLVVDPRRAFASDARFPGVGISTLWPDKALNSEDIDSRTAIVTLTHDPKLDDPALDVALRSEAFYIGSLGSRKTHASRLDRLHANGHDAASTTRIHGPIGLNIGASSPAEIAVSILAEVTQQLRNEVA